MKGTNWNPGRQVEVFHYPDFFRRLNGIFYLASRLLQVEGGQPTELRHHPTIKAVDEELDEAIRVLLLLVMYVEGMSGEAAVESVLDAMEDAIGR